MRRHPLNRTQNTQGRETGTPATRGGAAITHGSTPAPAPKFAQCPDEDLGAHLDPLDRAQILAVAILTWAAAIACAVALTDTRGNPASPPTGKPLPGPVGAINQKGPTP